MSLKRKRGIDEILDSRMITVVVGKGDSKREYGVHEGALAHLSGPLEALLTGGTQEALEGKIIWDDVEPATYRLLSHYAYQGSYPIPYPGNTSDIEYDLIEGGDAREETVHYESLRTWIESMSLENNNEHLAVFNFCKKHFCKYGVRKLPSPSRDHLVQGEESEGQNSEITVTLDDLLKPSELYILADRYFIEDLKELCVNDVDRKLCNAAGDTMLIGHICSVLRFLHAQTLPKDKLRKLFLRYLVADMVFTMKNGVEELIRDFADYAVELLLEIPHTYWEELQGRASESPDA
ncbi:hypothetical protein HER10_EVM0013244 [Colletotrichum scovillei]|uniref:BTB domain-containing protein n=1 Tax=Colletotrichum scovillei TaxID=1209932 RepID=A0A9P7QXD1_9PEZI|nr:uncharacterized protein HER10_EVM0013244 [Colletotrichum scovillei]KAF4778973.1 hypothetical protein HER10_EVM0013244 [Colletotrichum scovillei]KAG7039969.1 hypothetical protein JMJ78_0011626 [Colletotrichum scovillei]KAG7042141.1 hypothetical protein JMJ77_0010244 [Colletotrichum scovillei]KAG7062177.1 hypothetical protein JMJ76_0006455 [Colletotrichum scovillei]